MHMMTYQVLVLGQNTRGVTTGYTPFFMVYGSEAILLINLDYGAPRVRAYDEQGAEASLEDAMG